MTHEATITRKRILRGDKAAREPASMIDVQTVARLLTCSTRHVYRLADAGPIPRPVKLDGLVRWSRGAIKAGFPTGPRPPGKEAEDE